MAWGLQKSLWAQAARELSRARSSVSSREEGTMAAKRAPSPPQLGPRSERAGHQ